MIVVLIRHAEPGTGSDPGLSASGQKRAAVLATTLADAELTTIFTSDLRRTKETAAPIATKTQIQPREIAGDPHAARQQVMAAHGSVLVIGHTNTVPELIAALGGPANLSIKSNEFDRLFVLNVPSTGAASLLSMRYGT
jgi:phosphohistidine phosphatase SixA